MLPPSPTPIMYKSTVIRSTTATHEWKQCTKNEQYINFLSLFKNTCEGWCPLSSAIDFSGARILPRVPIPGQPHTQLHFQDFPTQSFIVLQSHFSSDTQYFKDVVRRGTFRSGSLFGWALVLAISKCTCYILCKYCHCVKPSREGLSHYPCLYSTQHKGNPILIGTFGH